MVCVWSGRPPALVGELFHLGSALLELAVEVVMKWVSIHIDNQYYPFTCSSPLLNLLGEVGVEYRNWVYLQAVRLYVSQVLLIHGFEAF